MSSQRRHLVPADPRAERRRAVAVVTAYREIRWPSRQDDLRSARRLTQQFNLLYKELSRIIQSSAKLRASVAEHQLIHELLIKWAQSGPRGVRPGEPNNDEAMERWMRVCLRNTAEDLRRQQRNHWQRAASVDEAELVAEEPTAEDQLVQQDGLGSARALVTHLFETVVPQVASRLKRDRQVNFIRDIDLLRRVVSGGRSIDQLALDEVTAERLPIDLRTLAKLQVKGYTVDRVTQRHLQVYHFAWLDEALQSLQACTDGAQCCRDLDGVARAVLQVQAQVRRAALDQRFTRCRRDIVAWVECMQACGHLAPEQAAALTLAVRTQLQLHRVGGMP